MELRPRAEEGRERAACPRPVTPPRPPQWYRPAPFLGGEWSEPLRRSPPSWGGKEPPFAHACCRSVARARVVTAGPVGEPRAAGALALTRRSPQPSGSPGGAYGERPAQCHSVQRLQGRELHAGRRLQGPAEEAARQLEGAEVRGGSRARTGPGGALCSVLGTRGTLGMCPLG